MQDLGNWCPLETVPSKSVYLRATAKDAALLRPGDVILSIKGTVGKSAIVGAAALDNEFVASQSCLALRVGTAHREKHLSPEYVLMYLRSPQGKAQLESLQVGGMVAHISPGTLLSSMLIPVPSAEEHEKVQEEFIRICQLEREAMQLQEEISTLASGRWPA
jgi:restriction endonuclease S subunit